MIAFRHRLETLARAPWLRRVWLYRLCYAIAVHFDALIDAAAIAVRGRNPEWAALNLPDALPVLGRERGIRRGFAETDVQYGGRTTVWLVSRRIKGGPWALMDQLAGFFAGYSVVIRIVNNHGFWCSRAADGTRTWAYVNPTNWSWDTGHGDPDSRYYVIIYTDGMPFFAPVKWGAGDKWGEGIRWGGDTQGIGQAVKDIVAEWNPPQAQCDWIVLASDPASFDPAGSGAGYPGGDWDQWANRLATAKYMRGH